MSRNGTDPGLSELAGGRFANAGIYAGIYLLPAEGKFCQPEGMLSLSDAGIYAGIYNVTVITAVTVI